ncbi:retrovirus-related pol polyprotein from transposon TNT 1-94 [Tanacetum coccineum]|uniref:Retrovirus-related pol polyprotein from transposon TNT 1-94 n=1 Tax=Tanacetum coccineum TaxID=301880 RepID=A0ABQ5D6Y4_9ASTR
MKPWDEGGLKDKNKELSSSLCKSTSQKGGRFLACFSIGKLKYEENLIDNIYETEKNKSLVSATPLSTAFFSSSIVQDFQDSPNDEEDTRSSHEYLNDLEEDYQARALLAKSKRFFKKGTQRFSSAKATDQTECHKCGKKGHFARDYWPTKDFEVKYNKVKAKLALLSSSASTSKASMVKNNDLIAKAYEWDEKEVSSDDNEMVEVKVLIALTEENDVVSKEGTKNGEWVKISMRKHVNTKILKENKNLRTELKELKAITKTWLNSSNKVNQCISEQIPSQKKRILGVDQRTEDPSSLGQKYLVFVKSSADDTKVTIPGVERHWLSEAEGYILPNHNIGRILPTESQRNKTDPSVNATDSATTIYDSADESLVCSTPLPLLKKLDVVEPISGPKTIKPILRLKSTFKAEALKGVIINEPSSAPAKSNRSSPASKLYSAPAGKLKSEKIKNDPPLAIVMKELNNIKLQVSKNQYEKTDHRTCDHAEYMSTMNISQHLKSLGRASSRSKIQRPSKFFFPPCTHCGYIDHLSNEFLNYAIYGLCGSYDHDKNGHNRIIPLEREINQRNPQYPFKRCEVFGSSTHTTTDHYDIEWFKRESCFFAKASENLNWLWHKRLAHLNFKTINKLAKQNLVIGLPSLIYSKDKPCSSCEKEKHHRANFKTKQTSLIKKCHNLLHMDLFGPVTPSPLTMKSTSLSLLMSTQEDDVNINTLTLEQYLDWVQDDIRPVMVKPKIGNNIEFEINSNFIRELRCKLFKGTDDEDAHEHVRRVLEIVDLFYFPGAIHDAVMLRVFSITLKGSALSWIKRLSAGLVTTWDLLEKAFIKQYCPPFKTAKKLEIIRNFKQEMD